MEQPDLTLDEIVGLIKQQQLKRGLQFEGMPEEVRIKYASACALALHVEVGELSSSWAFAPWKSTVTDVENIKREIIDCIFFLANISFCFDITTDDLQRMFFWVLNNNQRRMASGEHKDLSTDTQTDNNQSDNN